MKKFTEQEMRDAVAAKKAWAKRVGDKSVTRYLALIEKLSTAFMAFYVLADDVEFSDEEKTNIRLAFDSIADAMKSHNERVTGYKPGMPEACIAAGIE